MAVGYATSTRVVKEYTVGAWRPVVVPKLVLNAWAGLCRRAKEVDSR